MKKITLSVVAFLLTSMMMASQLIIVPTGSLGETRQIFRTDGLTVIYYDDHCVIGTIDNAISLNYTVIDENAWAQAGQRYFLVRHADEAYQAELSSLASILFENEHFMVVSTDEQRAALLYPAVHGGLIALANRPARLPNAAPVFRGETAARSQDIVDMVNAVNLDSLEAKVQHLQDFGTRNCYKQGSFDAQGWIYNKFASYGLTVEFHDFSMPGGNASDNVIATLTGTTLPDEYVVLGAHYDSYAGGSSEPGADDNATGTAGILEAARIMSQYTFDRSIIFACWSGEEYGLYGSDAWATEAAGNGMNILGYFNIDMAGYLEPGLEIHADMIAPPSAQELAQFYIDVCAVYLPDFPIEGGGSIGGDSDHTSFNQNGYMGIFPFEDTDNYSPYIHTSNDLIGPSVNNFLQHGKFTQATIASVATMASMEQAPTNLVGIAGDEQVDLAWTGIDSVCHYNIYRNDTVIWTTADTMWTDSSVVNGTPYTYYITAVPLSTGEESRPSNEVTVVPMPPIALPFFDDYETGGYYWTFDGSWGLREGFYYSPTHSMTESPSGTYDPNLEISATLRAIDLSGAIYSAEMSFWTRYSIEIDYDYVYLEVSTDGIGWDQLDVYSGTQSSWTEKSFPLNDYIGESNVLIRFRFTSDVYVEEDGMAIDDFMIDIEGVGMDEPGKDSYGLKVVPNPVSSQAMVSFTLDQPGQVVLRLTDINGRQVGTMVNGTLQAGQHNITLDLSGLDAGIYQCVLNSAKGSATSRIAVVR